VTDRLRQLQRLWRSPRLAVVAGAVLVLLGLGVAVAAGTLWVEYHLRAARLALERRDFPRARAHLTRCLQARPNAPEVHFLAARAARRAGDADAAERHLSTCQRLGWVAEAVELERALLRAQRGELARVEGYLLPGIRKDHPEAVLILEALAQGYLKTYRLGEALHCLDLWLQREPDCVPALVWRGEVKERRQQFTEAAAAYRRAVELDPDHDPARRHLAQVLLRADLAEEALGHFEHLYRHQPGNPVVLLGLARCQRLLGRRDEARQLLEALLAGQPGHVETLSERGRLALETGEAAAAEDWLRKAVALAPYDRDALYLLYQCLLQRGRRDEAQSHLTRLEAIAADLQLLSELTRKIAAAPNDPALRHEAGLICLRNGQDQEGLRWLQSALQEDPNHRPTQQALAEYYGRAGPRR
jgi:tetratricopeptide (TPR) repeat protein